jgi:hypothetical protein
LSAPINPVVARWSATELCLRTRSTPPCPRDERPNTMGMIGAHFMSMGGDKSCCYTKEQHYRRTLCVPHSVHREEGHAENRRSASISMGIIHTNHRSLSTSRYQRAALIGLMQQNTPVFPDPTGENNPSIRPLFLFANLHLSA